MRFYVQASRDSRLSAIMTETNSMAVPVSLTYGCDRYIVLTSWFLQVIPIDEENERVSTVDPFR
jgi:hypothetical protein